MQGTKIVLCRILKNQKKMQKYLVSIELCYSDSPEVALCSSITKNITIAVCDTFEDACTKGNEVLMHLENRFDFHVFPDGRVANKQRFSINGGCFNDKKTLVTNLAYLKTPFSFFAKIETLNFINVDSAINDAIIAKNRYIEYKNNEF